MTIGIPSVKRLNGIEYLLNTLTSIIETTSWQEKADVVVVVFLADREESLREEMARKIISVFYEYLELGFLQIIQAPDDFYPQLTHLQTNFRDTPERAKWRSKQALDYAFLFLYSSNLSTYYLHLEDDVFCATNFMANIKKYVADQAIRWVVLEFSELGFIGKLVHSEDLEKLAKFITIFYDQQPVDWLLRHFRNSMAQSYIKLRRPTLFQHLGRNSSLAEKGANTLIDKYFDAGEKPNDTDNPSAKVISSLKYFRDYIPDLAYSSGSGYFWAMAPRKGDTVHVIFDVGHRLHRIRVSTGNKARPKDILRNGVLWVSPTFHRIDLSRNLVECGNKHQLGKFSHGQIDVNNLEAKLNVTIRCITIEITENQHQWIVFFHIGIQVSTVV